MTTTEENTLRAMQLECAAFRKRIDAAIRQVRKAYNNGTPTEVVEQLHAAVNDCEDSYISLVNQANAYAKARA
jgi:predicted phage tail protein